MQLLSFRPFSVFFDLFALLEKSSSQNETRVIQLSVNICRRCQSTILTYPKLKEMKVFLLKGKKAQFSAAAKFIQARERS